MEIELQLLLDPAHNDRLLAHPLIAAHALGASHSAVLTAHYFDTPELHFLRHRAGLRVRAQNGHWVQTMKAGGGVQSGLHQREEWETPVSRPWPQLGKLRKAADAPWRALLGLDAPGLKEQLEVLFSVVVQRTTWQLDYQGSRIELVLDQGHIERQGQRVAINEIELELVSGAPASLFAFALRLLDDIPLRLSQRNKAERGYALCYVMGAAAVKAAPVALGHGASTADALASILSNCLDQIQGNEDGVLHGDAPESVHQMRVGVRRLRSAIKLFHDVAPCPAALQDDIAWLGAALGATRDWEVLRDETLTRVPPDEADAGARALLLAQVQRMARAQRSLAAQALRSPRYTRLLLSLWVWMREVAEKEDNDLAAPARRFADRTLRSLHKKMLRRADTASAPNPAQNAHAAHRLRIAGKRTRYTLEFFSALYQARATEHYLQALAQMQDALGQRNDAVVAARLLGTLKQQHPETASAIAFVRGYLLGHASTSTSIAGYRKQLHALRLPKRA